VLSYFRLRNGNLPTELAAHIRQYVRFTGSACVPIWAGICDGHCYLHRATWSANVQHDWTTGGIHDGS
jgi:hypothetical protein